MRLGRKVNFFNIQMHRNMKKVLLLILVIITSTNTRLTAQISYPGNNPGPALVKKQGADLIILENHSIRLAFCNNENKITIKSFEDKETNESMKFNDAALFELTVNNSTVLTSNDFNLVGLPSISILHVDPNSARYADKFPGKKISADIESQVFGLKVHWEASLRDGSNYAKQVFAFTMKDSTKISKIKLLNFPLEMKVRKEGEVDGSPLVHNTMFFALEHPLCKTEQSPTHISSYLSTLIPVMSTAWGTTPVNQLRRGFLYYTERERRQPYHQILHYNSWFDISWRDRNLNEEVCLDRINVFGDSLITKRHVALDAFLFDDGWDDIKTLWAFNSGFPNGFTKLQKAAESLNSSLGVWISPIGGYHAKQISRLKFGNMQQPPFETTKLGFSVAGPIYYKRIKEVTSSFVKNYGISMFKFDGMAVSGEQTNDLAVSSGADGSYQKEVEAFLKLINELTSLKPDLYMSLTTGTWPSVYWLFYGDNIWHGGDDTGMVGEGSHRQQWINFRDAATYKYVVKRAPLYPLNSLMSDGICIADNGYPGKFEMDDKDISDEIWSFFATGTNLQELYVNPHKLNTANWDCLARAAKWARENQSILTDVHWIGGDPANNEVYGMAAWSTKKSVLMLRNPSGQEKTIELKVAEAFEIPDHQKNDFVFYDATTSGQRPVIQGKSVFFKMKPFEVKVFNALPK
jgi:hypothetical protein